MKVYKKTLSNGLRIGSLLLKDSSILTIQLKGKAGSLNERGNEIGVAHMLEHLILSRIMDSKDGKDLKFIGSKYYGVTSREEVLYLLKVFPETYKKAFDLIHTIFLQPPFMEEEIDKVKEILINEAKRILDNPEKVASRRIYGLLYPNSRLEKLNTGEIEDIQKITTETVNNYYKRMYVASNFSLIVGGKDGKKYFGHMKRIFENIPRGTESNNIHHEENIGTRTQDIQMDIQAAIISIGYYGPKTKSEECFVCAQVLKQELTKVLREHLGIAYLVNATLSKFTFGSNFIITVGCSKDSIQTVLQEISNVIQKLSINIDKKEFELAKNSILAELIFELDKHTPKIEFLSGKYLFEGDINDKTMENELRKILSIRKDDVQEILKKNFINPKILIVS